MVDTEIPVPHHQVTMAQVGYDTRQYPGYVIVTGNSGGEHLTAGEAEDLAKQIMDAARTVRAHNRPKKKLGEY